MHSVKNFCKYIFISQLIEQEKHTKKSIVVLKFSQYFSDLLRKILSIPIMTLQIRNIFRALKTLGIFSDPIKFPQKNLNYFFVKIIESVHIFCKSYKMSTYFFCQK